MYEALAPAVYNSVQVLLWRTPRSVASGMLPLAPQAIRYVPAYPLRVEDARLTYPKLIHRNLEVYLDTPEDRAPFLESLSTLPRLGRRRLSGTTRREILDPICPSRQKLSRRPGSTTP